MPKSKLLKSIISISGLAGIALGASSCASLNNSVTSNAINNAANQAKPLVVSLSDYNVELTDNDTFQLHASVKPASADQKVKWYSTNEQVITVDQNGFVETMAPGTASVVCVSAADSTVMNCCDFTVKASAYTKVRRIELVDPTQSKLLIRQGSTMDLPKVHVIPHSAKNPELKWTSDFPKGLIINNKAGTIKCVSHTQYNSFKLTCKSVDDPSKSIVCSLTVKMAIPTEIVVVSCPKSLYWEEKGKILCHAKPVSDTTQNLMYESLTPDILEVTEKGYITAKTKTGDGKIRCYHKEYPNVCKIVTLPVVQPPLYENDSWEEVCYWATLGTERLHDHYFYSCSHNKVFPGTLIGLERPVTINGIEHKTRVIAENHDVISFNGNTAALTIELCTLLSDSNGNAITTKWDDVNNDYTNSTLRWNLNGKGSGTKPSLGVWTNSAFSMLPTILQSGIKSVNKQVSVCKNGVWELCTYNDALFPITYTEMSCPDSAGERFARQEGWPYKYWILNNWFADVRAKADASGYNKPYWLASPYAKDSNKFWAVDEQGNVDGYKNPTSDGLGVSFAFCL